MVNVHPPASFPGAPTGTTLAAGTPLFRIHSSRRTATDFNSRPAHCFYGGGRFDATVFDAYGFLYAGLTAAAAVCESLLRSVPFDADGSPRLVPRAAVRGRRLSFLRLGCDTLLVPLVSGRELAAVAQDSWLVHADAADYPFTRHWGHWIRAEADWAEGLLWRSKREPDDGALVLFADRCAPGVVRDAGPPAVDFDTSEGEEWLNSVLDPYHARLAP